MLVVDLLGVFVLFSDGEVCVIGLQSSMYNPTLDESGPKYTSQRNCLYAS